MPQGDRTGPNGQGPRTGRGMGFCAGYPTAGFMNQGFGRGCRGGFGRGRGFGFRQQGVMQPQVITESQEKEQKLLIELAHIDQRIIDDSVLLVEMYKEMQLQKLKTLEKKGPGTFLQF